MSSLFNSDLSRKRERLPSSPRRISHITPVRVGPCASRGLAASEPAAGKGSAAVIEYSFTGAHRDRHERSCMRISQYIRIFIYFLRNVGRGVRCEWARSWSRRRFGEGSVGRLGRAWLPNPAVTPTWRGAGVCCLFLRSAPRPRDGLPQHRFADARARRHIVLFDGKTGKCIRVLCAFRGERRRGVETGWRWKMVSRDAVFHGQSCPREACDVMQARFP